MKSSGLLWLLVSLSCVYSTTVAESVETCWNKKYTSESCHKVFCEPWQRCVDGKCSCKMPYQCPKNVTFSVCSEINKVFKSYCVMKSAECNFNKPEYKFASDSPCKGNVKVSIRSDISEITKGIVEIQLPGQSEKLIVCPDKWTVTEANVICRQLGFPKGAFTDSLHHTCTNNNNQDQCLHVTCRGTESSLAECTLNKGTISGDTLAAVACYEDKKGGCTDDEFTCVNGKCIPFNNTCNSENDCGDLSDEMCCSLCKKGFHCKSDVCIPLHYVCNGDRDCIRGEDEAGCKDLDRTHNEDQDNSQHQDNDQDNSQNQHNVPVNAVSYDIEAERKNIKKQLDTVNCGVPILQPDTKRVKRIIGGYKAVKNQFPWQVAIKDGTKVNCGGIYIGGCWVLTAAHCVRADQPQKYRVIIELLDRLAVNENVDSFPVKSVKVHEQYNSATYENDIALLEAVNIYNEPACMQVDNNLVPACVPWSPHLFKAGETCVVSGWGREEGFSKVFHLKWGKINLMDNCSVIYDKRFFQDKMECAGTYDGQVDACKGDSGGPLVCYDANNVVYVWGIVSWGDNCGVAGFPGVYTKVANYFEWISRHVGRQLIAKYNT